MADARDWNLRDWIGVMACAMLAFSIVIGAPLLVFVIIVLVMKSH